MKTQEELILERIKRIEERKKLIGDKHKRRLKKVSPNIMRVFIFFLKSYRKDILSFCGSKMNIVFDPSSEDAVSCFRNFEDGQYRGLEEIRTCHPNLLYAVLCGKKGWGLWVQQWCEGIAEGTFTKHEILSQFKEVDIEIPDSFLLDFENWVWRKREKYLKDNRF